MVTLFMGSGAALKFITSGTQTNGRPEMYIPLSLALLAFAFLGR